MVDQFLFATTGIRGSANGLFTPEYCSEVGRAIGAWKKQRKSHPTILLAMDTRKSSPMIMSALASGLSSEGVDVTVLTQPIPTPELVFLTTRYEYDMGIVVTGSHLPASDNGIILIDGDGSYYKGTLSLPEKYPHWQEMGRIKYFDNHWDSEYTRRYREHLKKAAAGLKIRGKVLMDSVHGPMRDYLYEILDGVFDEVLTINHEDDELISGRPSEPKPDTLGRTIEFMKQVSVELGIATDLDGDRVVFITKEGNVLPGDVLGAIFAIHSWKNHPDKEVVIPINTSAIIPTLAEKYGGKYYYTKVGAPSIIEGIMEKNAYYGFEETGKFFFNPDSLYPDGAYSSIILLQILKQKSLKEIVENLPKFFALKTKTPSKRSEAQENFQRILDDLEKLYELLPEDMEVENVNKMDGIRINFSDKSWILIRQSGTEDNLRVFTESQEQERTKLMNKITLKFVKNYL